MQPKIAAQMFKNLVKEAGGKEAAAAAITSAVGNSISIGSLTKIEQGDASVPLLWAWALQDATGNYCFDAYRVQVRPDAVEGCAYALTGEVAKEHGEAIEAGLKAARSSSDEHWSRAAVEYREAAQKHTDMANLCEARAEGLQTGAARAVPIRRVGE